MVEDCTICKARGCSTCTICGHSDPLFPHQFWKVSACPSCGSLFHKACVRDLPLPESCPSCASLLKKGPKASRAGGSGSTSAGAGGGGFGSRPTLTSPRGFARRSYATSSPPQWGRGGVGARAKSQSVVERGTRFASSGSPAEASRVLGVREGPRSTSTSAPSTLEGPTPVVRPEARPALSMTDFTDSTESGGGEQSSSVVRVQAGVAAEDRGGAASPLGQEGEEEPIDLTFSFG